MTAKVMLDTNVLVYAYDCSAAFKQQTAYQLLDRLAKTNTGFLSVQVLSEFFVTVTRKIPHPLTLEDAVVRIENFCRTWTVLPLNEMIICEALRGVQLHQFSYWDAQIWASARLNQVSLVLSEDFSHNQVVESIRFFNPFRPEFGPAELPQIF